jgi:hypothetical protein
VKSKENTTSAERIAAYRFLGYIYFTPFEQDRSSNHNKAKIEESLLLIVWEKRISFIGIKASAFAAFFWFSNQYHQRCSETTKTFKNIRFHAKPNM